MDGLNQQVKRLLRSQRYRHKDKVEMILTKICTTAVKIEAVLF